MLFKILKNFIYDIHSIVFMSHTDFDDRIYIDIGKVINNIDECNRKRHKEEIAKLNEERKRLNL